MSDSFKGSSKADKARDREKEKENQPPAKPAADAAAAKAGGTGPLATPLPNPAGMDTKPSAPPRMNPMAGKVYGAYRPPVKADAAAAPAAKPEPVEEPKEEEQKPEPGPTIEMSDAFKRGKGVGSGRLSGGGEARTHGEMVARLEVAMNAVIPLIASLEPRVEVMRRAFQEAGHEVPGVPKEEFKFELTPRMTKIVGYLTGAVKKTPGLARQMALAIFRFHDTEKLLLKANRAIADRDIPPTMHEMLGLSHFYLANFHEEFKSEAVLAQLFPPPAGASTSVKAATQEVKSEMNRALFEARKTLVKNAEALVANAAPRIEVILAALSFMDQIGGAQGAMFKPGLAVARVMSLQFIGDKAAVVQMKKVVGFQERLIDQLKRVERDSDMGNLQVVYDGYVELVKAWDAMPALREHLPLKVLPEYVEPEAASEGGQTEAARTPWT